MMWRMTYSVPSCGRIPNRTYFGGTDFLWFTVSEMDLPRGERDFGTGHTQQWEDVTKGVTLQCIGNQKARHGPGAGELS